MVFRDGRSDLRMQDTHFYDDSLDLVSVVFFTCHEALQGFWIVAEKIGQETDMVKDSVVGAVEILQVDNWFEVKGGGGRVKTAVVFLNLKSVYIWKWIRINTWIL